MRSAARAHAQRMLTSIRPSTTTVARPREGSAWRGTSGRGSRSFALALAAALVATSAQASDPATAQVLFDQARKLMAEQRWTEACLKLQESERLDPAGGTLLHLAVCREREGRIATAWALYQEALAQARRDGRRDRARIAQERIDALGGRLPRMRVRVAAADRALPGFTLRRDGEVVGEPQWNEPVPVDPGTRVLEAQADGRRTWTARIEVPAAAGEVAVDVPELEPSAKTPPPAPARVDEAVPSPPVAPAPAPTSPPPNRSERVPTLTYVFGVAGVVAAGSFAYFALRAKGEYDRLKGDCGGHCSDSDVRPLQQADLAADISLGVSLVSFGLATWFFLRAPATTTPTLTVAPGARGPALRIQGAF